MAFTPQDAAQEARAADERIRPHARETYLESSPHYRDVGGAEVFFKLENLQHTGSFKARGALNKLLSLAQSELTRGVVAASTGNHGAAVAFAAGKVGTRAVVFVPEHASSDKLRMVERLGAEVKFHGDDCVVSEVSARRYAKEQGLTYVSPYNDPMVIAGQGTIGVELERQLDRTDAVFVSLGGGGLISGVAAYLKSVRPDVRVVGCSPEHSQVMIQSVKAGEILDIPSRPTLSDGTAGGVEPGAITFDLCRALVDDYITVTEEEIADSWSEFTGVHHMMIEGAAAVAIASFMKLRRQFSGKNVVVVLCGANISLETIKELCS
jgi:threonine dehydratase